MFTFLLAVVLPASWSGLTPSASRPAVETVQAVAGGGEELKPRAPFVLHQAAFEAGGDDLRLVVQRSGGGVEITPAALGWPESWKDQGRLRVRLWAEEAVTVDVGIWVPRGHLTVSRELAAGAWAEWVMDLDDLALAAGVGPLWTPNAVRLNVRWPDDRPRTLRVGRWELESLQAPRPPVVDPFGQRRSGTWPGKVTDVAELRRRAESETRALAQMPLPADRDRFGGWTGGPRFEPGPVFRVAQGPGGKWWLVTPEGNPFFSLGTTGVRVSFVMDTARAADRRFLFAALPANESEGWFEGVWPTANGDVDLPGNVHFYRWNVMRKYGTLEAWVDRVLERFPRWGLNTIGAWSEEPVLRQTRVPHTRFLRARVNVPGQPWVHGFPDVWDPRWEAWVDAEFARETASERGNPWLIGYFVDNEGGWRDLRLLEFPADSRLREAWVAFVQAEASTLEAFGRIWGRSFASWAEVAALREADIPAAGLGAALMKRFEAHYAERYASTVARLLRKHDPDHLYLGCRFVRMPPDEGIVRALGRHVDVLSVNCYSRVPDPAAFAEWHRMSGGRPILIGEFHSPLASERQLPPPWPAFPAAEREAMVREFVETWARQPWAVGCHWYQHADQPITGRHTDGENQTVGVVDITDTPHEHLVRAFQEVGAAVYRWHEEGASRP